MSIPFVPCSFHILLRGSVSLLVDPNFQKTMQTTSLDTVSTSNTDGRRVSRVVNKELTRRMSRAHTKKDASSKHLYGKEVCRISSGNYFGEEALLQKEERAPHTVRTNEMVEALAIHVNIFNYCLYSYFEEIVLKRAEFLAELEWFKHWTPHHLRQLTFMLQEKHYNFHDCLYRQEMYVPSILFIQSGSVRISTHCNKQPPDELVSKILPPKDHLPEILAEDLTEENSSKVSVFSATSKQSLNTESRFTPGTPGPSRYNSGTSLVKIRSTPSIHRKQRPDSTSKEKPKRKASKEKRFMGFIIHHPSPALNINICILGPGDVLCDIEAICKLRKHLFNAVCESDVIIYELNRFYIELMFEKSLPQVMYQMTSRGKQRVEAWGNKHTGVHMFKPLRMVLEQIENGLVEQGAHKMGRKKPLYTPVMLAFTAIRGLGKMSLDSLSNKDVQYPMVQVQGSHMSSASTGHVSPNEGPPSPFPLSPFEPRIPDFERLASLMLYNHPRFNQRHSALRHGNRKCLFDSPIPARRSHGHVSITDANDKSSIPISSPYPYPVLQKNPQLEASGPPKNEALMKIETTPHTKSLLDDMGEDFAGANDPVILSKIRMGILFSKNKTPPPSRSKDTSSREDGRLVSCKRLQPKLGRSKSASKRAPTPILPIQSISSDHHDHMLEAEQIQESDDVHKEEEKDKVKKQNTKTSFSVDNELTSIPKEYSILYGREGLSSKGSDDEYSECSRGSHRGSCKSCPPYVKTMVHVIENRTSHLLTR